MDGVLINIVNYNGAKYLPDCLWSLRGQSFKYFQIFIYDNLSSDNSVNLIENNFPEVQLIKNTKNIGFCAANNLFFNEFIKSKYNYAFLLNADTILPQDSLSHLVYAAQKEKKYDIFSPKILKYPNTKKIWYAGGHIDLKRGIASHKGYNENNNLFVNTSGHTDFISGCSMFIRKRILKKIGLFDERFFAYFEDVDLSIRANKAGNGCFYHPEAIVYHKGGVINSPESFYYFNRNRFLLVKKHATLSDKLYFYPFIIKNIGFQILRLMRSHKNLYLNLLFQVIVDITLNRFGKKQIISNNINGIN